MQRRDHCLWACSVLALTSAAEAGESVTYSYDALGRLTATTTTGGPNSGVATSIAYDPAGNRSAYNVGGVNSPSVAGGGFETPDAGASYQYQPTAAFTHNSGVAGNGSAWGFAAAPEGDQVAFIQTIAAPAVITLPVSGLAAGTSYAVRFHIALRPGYAANPISVAFNGTPLGTFTPGSTAFAAGGMFGIEVKYGGAVRSDRQKTIDYSIAANGGTIRSRNQPGLAYGQRVQFTTQVQRVDLVPNRSPFPW